MADFRRSESFAVPMVPTNCFLRQRRLNCWIIYLRGHIKSAERIDALCSDLRVVETYLIYNLPALQFPGKFMWSHGSMLCRDGTRLGCPH